MIKMIKRLYKRKTIKRWANECGERLMRGTSPLAFSKFQSRNLIRLNRICEGLKPFSYDKDKARVVAGVIEWSVALRSFGNIV